MQQLLTTQVPLKHGLPAHSSMLVSQSVPVNPNTHMHSYPLIRSCRSFQIRKCTHYDYTVVELQTLRFLPCSWRHFGKAGMSTRHAPSHSQHQNNQADRHICTR